MLRVGSDPEVLLIKGAEIISAIDIIPGSKDFPLQVDNGSISHDNIFAEFNSKPSDNLAEFIHNHQLIINDLKTYISKHGLDVDFSRSAVMADQDLLSDPRAMIAGCESDFNVWEMRNNPKPSYMNNSLRAAGGHLHISFSDADYDRPGTMSNRVKFVKALDLVLGIPSVLMDHNGALRKTLYGKAGACRMKSLDGSLHEYGNQDPYNGVEYRTLSNFWLQSEELMEWAYSGVSLVHDQLEAISQCAIEVGDRIVNAINTNDKREAESLVTLFNINVVG